MFIRLLVIQKGNGGTWRLPEQAYRSSFQLNVAKCRRKKAPHFRAGLLHLFNAWQFPTLAWGDPTLPSALRRFTSEFGMGSGGTTALKPPGKSWCTKRIFYAMTALPSLSHTGHILQYAPADVLALRLVTPQNLSFPLIFIRYRLKIVSLKNASGVVRLSLTGH